MSKDAAQGVSSLHFDRHVALPPHWSYCQPFRGALGVLEFCLVVRRNSQRTSVLLPLRPVSQVWLLNILLCVD